jgi:hypothetical protein
LYPFEVMMPPGELRMLGLEPSLFSIVLPSVAWLWSLGESRPFVPAPFVIALPPLNKAELLLNVLLAIVSVAVALVPIA